MERPNDGFELRMEISIQGPGFTGGQLRISEQRQVQQVSLHDLAQLMLRLDELINTFTTKSKT